MKNRFEHNSIQQAGSSQIEHVYVDAKSDISKKIEVKESIENAYIQEPTLEATLAKISEIDKEKRKLIVYVGVHPHEGTAELTRKYADEWSKKYGVLVVCQPTEETPHAIWDKHKKNISTDEISPLPKDIHLDEYEYEDQFSLGEETFFVSFHGTPLNKTEEGRKLAVFTSMYKDAPDMYTRGTIPLRYSKPEIVEGLDGILPDVEQSGYPGNVVTVEYYYKGVPVETGDPYIENILKLKKQRHSNGVPLLFEVDDPNWWKKTNIEPEYLVQPKLSPEDVTAFEETYIKQLETLLEYLSKKITSNKKQ